MLAQSPAVRDRFPGPIVRKNIHEGIKEGSQKGVLVGSKREVGTGWEGSRVARYSLFASRG